MSLNQKQLQALRDVRADLADLMDDPSWEADPETQATLELIRLRLADIPQLGDDEGDDEIDSQAARQQELWAHGDDRPAELESHDRHGRAYRPTYNDAGERCCDL